MKKRVRQVFLVLLDVAAINLAYYLAFFIRFEGQVFGNPQALSFLKVYEQNILIIVAIKLAVFAAFRIYNSLWRYASVEELIQVVFATVSASIATVVYFHFSQAYLPRSIYIVTMLLDILMIGGIRFSYRSLRTLRDMQWFRPQSVGKRTLIYGAGDAGVQLARELKASSFNRGVPVGFLDDDAMKIGRMVLGIPVIGGRDILREVVKEKGIGQIILAMPSAEGQSIRDIVDICSDIEVDLKTVPSISELIDGVVHVNAVRDVEIDDLLGRDSIDLDIGALSHALRGKRILVTGGGGSIGSEISRQVAKYQPEALMILDSYENNAYDIEQELRRRYPELLLFVRIATVRDRWSIFNAMRQFKPDIVYHAAAHKHVPLMESSPSEALKNNVFGTWNTMAAARKSGVGKFVLISTDKAVNPTNVMGATKRICEQLIQSMNGLCATEFVAVRFGNVLGSNGSVIPLFKKQIAAGGPVTVTHPDIIRYFMTIPEACQLVIQAGAIAEGGEIFVLDMGKPVRIADLARNLIRLSGYEPDIDIAIEYIGLRPGEKMFEELLLNSERTTATRVERIFVEKSTPESYSEMIQRLRSLRKAIVYGDAAALKALKSVLPDYSDGYVVQASKSGTV